MSQQELMLLIGGVSLLVVVFTAAMYVVFARFLSQERRRGENFRAVHRDDPP